MNVTDAIPVVAHMFVAALHEHSYNDLGHALEVRHVQFEKLRKNVPGSMVCAVKGAPFGHTVAFTTAALFSFGLSTQPPGQNPHHEMGESSY